MATGRIRLPGQGQAVSQIISKIVISLLFGGLAFVVSVLFDLESNSKVLLGIGVSIFVSGIAFLTQFLVEVEDHMGELDGDIRRLGPRYDRHVTATQQTIQREFNKISDATKLFSLVEASALQTDAVTQLVRNATTIKRAQPSLVFDFAQSEMQRLSLYLSHLGQGSDVTYEGEDRDWLLGLTRASSTSIDAVSLTTVDGGGHGMVDGGLWSSDLGQRYLDAQRDAVSRGVNIRRIFILDRPDISVVDDDLAAVMRQHEDIGVTVRKLLPKQIDKARLQLLVDFIVIDGVLVYQSTPVSYTPSGSPPIILSTRLITDSTQVDLHIDRYRTYWEATERDEGPTKA